jgi:hypothetical protein
LAGGGVVALFCNISSVGIHSWLTIGGAGKWDARFISAIDGDHALGIAGTAFITVGTFAAVIWASGGDKYRSAGA